MRRMRCMRSERSALTSRGQVDTVTRGQGVSARTGGHEDMRARRQGLSFQVAGGGPGWQVAGIIGRDAMTSHPFDDGAGSHRVLAGHDEDVCLSANGRDGDHVPTQGTKKDSTWCCPYLFGFWPTDQPFNGSTRYAGNVNAGSLRISPPAMADSWARMPVQVQLAD